MGYGLPIPRQSRAPGKGLFILLDHPRQSGHFRASVRSARTGFNLLHLWG